MKNLLAHLSLLLLLTACGMDTNDASPTVDNTGEIQIQTHEEQIVESRYQAQIDSEDDNRYTRTQAEHLVKRHLNIDNESDKVVVFDREENNKYIIRVMDLLEDNDNNHKGLYLVDPTTGKIEEYQK